MSLQRNEKAAVVRWEDLSMMQVKSERLNPLQQESSPVDYAHRGPCSPGVPGT